MKATSKDFNKMAETVTSAFFNAGTSLNDAIVKEASDSDLNIKETQRLVETANSMAVIKMLKVASDKKAELDLADPKEVLNKTHALNSALPEQDIVKTASTKQKLPNTRTSIHKVFPSMEKIAAETPKRDTRISDYFALQKEAIELNYQKTAAELKIHNTFDTMIGDFESLYGPDFVKFAKEVHTMYGNSSTVPLKYLANKINRLPDVDNLHKVGYLIDDRQDILKKYAGMHSSLVSLIELNKKLAMNKIASNKIQDAMTDAYHKSSE